jgi:hypothetical protein
MGRFDRLMQLQWLVKTEAYEILVEIKTLAVVPDHMGTDRNQYFYAFR